MIARQSVERIERRYEVYTEARRVARPAEDWTASVATESTRRLDGLLGQRRIGRRTPRRSVQAGWIQTPLRRSLFDPPATEKQVGHRPASVRGLHPRPPLQRSPFDPPLVKKQLRLRPISARTRLAVRPAAGRERKS